MPLNKNKIYFTKYLLTLLYLLFSVKYALFIKTIKSPDNFPRQSGLSTYMRLIMNVKAIPHKHKVTSVTTIAVLIALTSCEYKTANSSVTSNYSYESKQVIASEYELLAAKKTGEHSGEGVIRIDGFKLNVTFDYEGVPDSYGVVGSDFKVAEITNLSIESVTDLSGKPWNDFTNRDDHKNINILLVGYIDRNHWIEEA
nr:hypothetical protein [Acinetobacter pittii]